MGPSPPRRTRSELEVSLQTMAAARGRSKTIVWIFVVILALLALAAWPAWPHSKTWGYYPSGILGVWIPVLITLNFLGIFDSE